MKKARPTKIMSIAPYVAEKASQESVMLVTDVLTRAMQLSESVEEDRKMRDDFLSQIKEHFGEEVLAIVNDFLAKKTSVKQEATAADDKPRFSTTHPSIDKETAEHSQKTK